MVISFANEKLSGPIGVNQSIVIPVADLILFESSYVHLYVERQTGRQTETDRQMDGQRERERDRDPVFLRVICH